MLIHLGDGEFIGVDNCLGIFTWASLSEEHKSYLRRSFPELSDKVRSVVITRNGKLIPSKISSEALCCRVGLGKFPNVYFRRKR